MKVNYREISESLKFPLHSFPKYEGLNGGLNNQYWLGLYWRNNQFSIDFMSAACRLCQDTNIGKINVIPWKALVIKGIKAHERIRWEKVMGKFGINDRHSALELNWHLPVLDKNALALKQYLVRELDQLDISTHGLTFTIRTKHAIYLFTSIVIEEIPKVGGGYNVLYAKNFDPNNTTYITYASDVRKEVLPALLIELSKMYFRQLVPEKQPTNDKQLIEKRSPLKIHQSYQCSNCLSIFDKRYGDSLAGISAGTPFEDLPSGYTCPVCGGPKSEFGLMES
jgi:rubredoxin